MSIKKISLAALFTIATVSTTAAFAHDGHHSKLVAADDYITTKICVAAAKGNRAHFAQLLKDANISKRYAAKYLQCNEAQLPDFVAKHNDQADRVLKLLPLDSHHVSIRDIARVEHLKQK